MDPFQNSQQSSGFDDDNAGNSDVTEEMKLSDTGSVLDYLLQQRLAQQTTTASTDVGMRDNVVNQLLIHHLQEEERRRQLNILIQQQRREQMQQLQSIYSVARSPFATSPTVMPEWMHNDGAVSSSNLLQLQLNERHQLQLQLQLEQHQRHRHLQQNRIQLEQLQRLQTQQLLLEQEQQRRQQSLQLTSPLYPGIQRDGGNRPLPNSTTGTSLQYAPNTTNLPNSRSSHADFFSLDNMLLSSGVSRGDLLGTNYQQNRTDTGLRSTSDTYHEAKTADYTNRQTNLKPETQQPAVQPGDTAGVASRKKTPSKEKSTGDVNMERKRMLEEIPSPPQAEGECNEESEKSGGNKKRRRRATHGKISFGSLAKSIGQKWQAFDDEQKMHYEKLAVLDLQRYHNEMEEYYTKMIHKKGPNDASPESNVPDQPQRYKTERE